VFCIPIRKLYDCTNVTTFAFRKMPKAYKDTCNRVVCILHEVFCTIAVAIYFATDDNLNIKCGQTTTGLEYLIIVISTAFFIYDIFSKKFLGILDSAALLHHVMVIGVTVSFIVNGQGVNFWVGALFFSEGPMPFMHMRFILRSLGLTRTKAYNLIDDIYVFLYFIGRVLIDTPLFLKFSFCDAIPLLTRIGVLPISLLSLHAFWKMFKRL